MGYPAASPSPAVTMSKIQLQQHILEQLQHDLLIAQRAAQTAYEAATDKANIAENKYDTLGLEASYLATGQARRLAEIEQALAALRQLPTSDFDPQRGIQLGALVLLADAADQQRWLLLAPDAAGLKISQDEREIMLITPHSPIGQRLLGQAPGDEFSLTIGKHLQHFEVLQVH
jgi:transcription elongation GreA/GreB family factor